MKAVIVSSVLFGIVQLAYGWNTFTLPNPMQDPEGCGRGVPGWVCSPDGLADKRTLSVIQGNINKIYAGGEPYSKLSCPDTHKDVAIEVFATIVGKVDGYGDARTRVRNFAKGIHKRFGVGDAVCGSGAVIAISVEDRQVYISTGKLVKEHLSDKRIEHLVRGIRGELRSGKYGKALEKIVIEVGLALSTRVPDESSESTDESDWDPAGAHLFAFIPLIAFITLFAYSMYTNHRNEAQQQEVAVKLRKMQQDYKASKQGKYISTSCPICLEEFTPAEAPTPAPNAPSTPKAKGLFLSLGDEEDLPLLDGEDEAPVNDPEPSPGRETTHSTTSVPARTIPIPRPVTSPSRPSGTSVVPPLATHAIGRSPLGGSPAQRTAGAANAAEGASMPGYFPALADSSHPHEHTSSSSSCEPRHPFMLPCGHTFCETCVMDWLKKKPECPVCRKPATTPVSAGPTTGAPPESLFSPRMLASLTASPRGDQLFQSNAASTPRPRLIPIANPSLLPGQDFDMYGPELEFRLSRLRQRHAHYISQSFVDDLLFEAHGGRWPRGRYLSRRRNRAVEDWGAHPTFIRETSAAARAARVSDGSRPSSASFGGGMSAGGGGGSW